MAYLMAAAAFAVLMIIFSTMVTALTESYLRIFSVRGKILAQSVLKFLNEEKTAVRFLKELGQKPVPAKENGDEPTEDEIPSKMRDAYNALTLNKSVGATVSPLHSFARMVRKIFRTSAVKNLKRVERLSTYSFLQRLAQTEIGEKIAEEGNELVLRSLTVGFERYVAASNEVFRKHAQAMTMVLSFVFAFAFNIDAIRVFQHLVENPQISQRLVDNGEAAMRESEAATQAYLEALRGETSGQDAEAYQATLQDALAKIRGTLEDVETTSAKLEVPIGWLRYPWHEEVIASDEDQAPFKFVRWFLGVVLAGFLIGLGGPFWYKVFTSLSHVIQTLRSLHGQPRTEVIEADRGSGQPASQELVDALIGGEKSQPGDLMSYFQASTGVAPPET